jgi:hypothetical protein
MTTNKITVGVDRLRRMLDAAVSWVAHAPGAAAGPADLDLPLALAAELPAPARAPEVRSAPARRPRGRRSAAAVRR